jgi:hypothetical protein
MRKHTGTHAQLSRENMEFFQAHLDFVPSWLSVDNIQAGLLLIAHK